MVEPLVSLALVDEAEHRTADALTRLERAIKILERSFGPENSVLINALESYEAVLKSAGRTADAAAVRARYEKIRSRTGNRWYTYPSSAFSSWDEE